MKLNYAESVKVLPVLAPADIVATATPTQYVDLNFAQGLVEFGIAFGAIASTDSTGEVIVTIEANAVADTTSSDSSETAIAFNYRLSAAVGTDSGMGAITAATASGAAVNNTADNKVLLCYVDPSLVAQTSGARFVRAVLTPTAEITSTVGGAVARFIPRYAGNAQPSST